MTWNQKTLALYLFAVVLGAGVAHAKEATFGDDQIAEIVKTANESEIDAGKLAAKRAQNAQVKEFANHMIAEHKDNNKDAKNLFKDTKVSPKSSAECKDMKKDAKAKMSALKKMKGADFDKEYISQQVAMHQEVLNNIDQKLLPSVSNPKMKEFLTTTREHVANHLTQAQSIQSSLQ